MNIARYKNLILERFKENDARPGNAICDIDMPLFLPTIGLEYNGNDTTYDKIAEEFIDLGIVRLAGGGLVLTPFGRNFIGFEETKDSRKLKETTLDEFLDVFFEYFYSNKGSQIWINKIQLHFSTVPDVIINSAINKFRDSKLIDVNPMDVNGTTFTHYTISVDGIKAHEKYKSYKKFIKNVEKKEKTSNWSILKDTIGVLGILSAIILGVLNFNKDKSIEKAKNENLELQTEIKDIKKYIDSVTNLKTNILDNNLNERIKTFKPNTYRVIDNGKLPTITMGDPPHKEIELMENKTDLRFSFLSNNATSTDIIINISYVISDDLNEFKYKGRLELINEATMAENQGIEGKIRRDTSDKNLFIVWCRGSYKNITKTQPIKLDEMRIINIQTGVVNIAGSGIRKKVMALIKQNEKTI